MRICGIIGDFCRQHSISLTFLAKKFGFSVAHLYAVSNGRRPWRPIYDHALQGLARELKMTRPTPRYSPTPKTPPHNREQIKCSCGGTMNRGNVTKDPDSGVRLWRMFCKGDRTE